MKIKVAAYCRVSTDHTDQLNSLENQKKYFKEYIERNPDWELSKIYIDEGITGTSIRNRVNFQKMMSDAQQHEFDLLLTKEISRFARNTLDSIFYTRKLKELGIGVVFLNDHINTLDPDAELRLTIMSSLAQEESRKTSERVKWGQKRCMENGVVFGRSMLGYDVKNGKMIVNEEGAKIVGLIFHKFLKEGKGTRTIAKELMEEGIKTFFDKEQWSSSVILRILKNEKYVGDLKQKKTYTPNYLNHEKKYNKGEEEFIILTNHHEPIISREIFEQTQEELMRRCPNKSKDSRYSNRYCFSGKIKCGYCGASFVSCIKKRKGGDVYQTWRCYEAACHGNTHVDSQGKIRGCSGRQVSNEILMELMKKLVLEMELDKIASVEKCRNIVTSVMVEKEQKRIIKNNRELKKLIQKKNRLVELFVLGEINKEDYYRVNSNYDLKISEINQEIEQDKENQISNHRKNEIESYIKAILRGERIAETFYQKIIEKIVVYDKNHIEVYLFHFPHPFTFQIQ